MTADKDRLVGAPGLVELLRVAAGRPTGPSGSIGTYSPLEALAYPPLEHDHARVEALQVELSKLRTQAAKLGLELQQERTNIAGSEAKVAELRETLEQVQRKQNLAFLLDRVSPQAQSALLDSEDLLLQFQSDTAYPIFAVSVDIRRSTDLMLKARRPQAFASFITKLCNDLMDLVRGHHGVVDKFTGDGILCFFPEFFSGPDAGYLALSVADACHRAFEAHYREYRGSFSSVLKDVGLGIGIDYGDCHFMRVAGSLTIVGPAVVYACRLSAAPAGTTLLNQPAYEVLSQKHGDRVFLTETGIDIKHEGSLVVYSARLSPGEPTFELPPWLVRQPSG